MKWFAIAMLLLVPIDAGAQPIRGEWTRVQNLAAGSKVRVVVGNGAELKGRIVAVSVDSLTMILKGQSRSVPIEDVVRVQARSNTQRLLLGAILVPVSVFAGAMTGFYGDYLGLFAAAGAAGWAVPIYVTLYEVRAT